MKIKFIAASFAALAFTGCSTFNAVQKEQDGVRTTTVTIRNFMDSKSELSKLRTTLTDKTQGIYLGSINQESSGSNAVSIIEAVSRGATEGAAKALLKP